MLVFGFHAVTSRLRREATSITELYVDAKREDGRMRELLAVAAQAGVAPGRARAPRHSLLGPPRRHQGVVEIAESSPPAVGFEALLDAIEG
ncbi:MAG: RNA methyltransferase substrate-binding domain-containing protein, partial [Burkholderiales bacterium]